ncbi:hypothetical protein [Actinomadura sp. KC06]|nr:hypothetical protein [Actinomadura sp. KC06]
MQTADVSVYAGQSAGLVAESADAGAGRLVEVGHDSIEITK